MKRNLFKKIGGEKIESIDQYIVDYLESKKHLNHDSNIQISIGCDSQSKRRSVNYAITIVMYDDFKHNGAHYVYKRIRIPKSYLRKNKRLSQWYFELPEDFNDIEELKKLKGDKNLNDLIIARLWNEVEYLLELGLWLDEKLQGKYFIKHEKNADGSQPYRLPIIHVDFNPNPGMYNEYKSNKLYQSAMGMLGSMGFKVVGKPEAWASSSAADLLCK